MKRYRLLRRCAAWFLVAEFVVGMGGDSHAPAGNFPLRLVVPVFAGARPDERLRPHPPRRGRPQPRTAAAPSARRRARSCRRPHSIVSYQLIQQLGEAEKKHDAARMPRVAAADRGAIPRAVHPLRSRARDVPARRTLADRPRRASAPVKSYIAGQAQCDVGSPTGAGEPPDHEPWSRCPCFIPRACAGSSPDALTAPPPGRTFSANRPAASTPRRRSSARSTRFCSTSPSRSSPNWPACMDRADLFAALARRVAALDAAPAGQPRAAVFLPRHQRARRVRARMARRPRRPCSWACSNTSRSRIPSARSATACTCRCSSPACSSSCRAGWHRPAKPSRRRLRQATLLVFWLAQAAVLMSYTMSGAAKLGARALADRAPPAQRLRARRAGGVHRQAAPRDPFHQPARRVDHPSPVADVAAHARGDLRGTASRSGWRSGPRWRGRGRAVLIVFHAGTFFTMTIIFPAKLLSAGDSVLCLALRAG